MLADLECPGWEIVVNSCQPDKDSHYGIQSQKREGLQEEQLTF